jgi:hypothetical protein
MLQRTKSTGSELSFDVTVFAGRTSSGVRFYGDVAQGPPAARFVYVCSGTLAGQADSCWTRRAKIPLAGIAWAMVQRMRRDPAARLEARIEGSAGDRGPVCGGVKLRGWRLIAE